MRLVKSPSGLPPLSVMQQSLTSNCQSQVIIVIMRIVKSFLVETFFPVLSLIGQQAIPTWPKMLTFPSLRQMEDEISQSDKAARVFREIMDTPDKGISKELLENAECVAVFPTVLKAGFIFGGRGGRGVASCRTAAGWSAPAFFNLGGGSFGLQIGASSTQSCV